MCHNSVNRNIALLALLPRCLAHAQLLDMLHVANIRCAQLRTVWSITTCSLTSAHASLNCSASREDTPPASPCCQGNEPLNMFKTTCSVHRAGSICEAGLAGRRSCCQAAMLSTSCRMRLRLRAALLCWLRVSLLAAPNCCRSCKMLPSTATSRSMLFCALRRCSSRSAASPSWYTLLLGSAGSSQPRSHCSPATRHNSLCSSLLLEARACRGLLSDPGSATARLLLLSLSDAMARNCSFARTNSICTKQHGQQQTTHFAS
jgi:hypothetical protein